MTGYKYVVECADGTIRSPYVFDTTWEFGVWQTARPHTYDPDGIEFRPGGVEVRGFYYLRHPWLYSYFGPCREGITKIAAVQCDNLIQDHGTELRCHHMLLLGWYTGNG